MMELNPVDAIASDQTRMSRRRVLLLSVALLSGLTLPNVAKRLAVTVADERSPSFLLRRKLAREIAAVQHRAQRLTARERPDRLEEYRGYIVQSAVALSRVDPLADLQDAFYHQRLCLTHVMGFAELMAEQSRGSAWLSDEAIRLRASGMRLLAGIERLERRYYGDDLRRGSDEALRRLVDDTF